MKSSFTYFLNQVHDIKQIFFKKYTSAEFSNQGKIQCPNYLELIRAFIKLCFYAHKDVIHVFMIKEFIQTLFFPLHSFTVFIFPQDFPAKHKLSTPDFLVIRAVTLL